MFISRKGIALVICAPSGTGKTTLIKKLLKEFPHFGFSISHTTRPPRDGELHGVDYHFTSVSEFKEQRNNGYFAEWAQVHGAYYGTPLKATLDMLEKGQDVIFDVDVQGASQLRLNLPTGVYIFILPPSLKELRTRLELRGTDSKESIERRMNNAVYEINQAHWFDYWVVNSSLESAYDQVRASYIAATLQPRYYPSLAESILNPDDES